MQIEINVWNKKLNFKIQKVIYKIAITKVREKRTFEKKYTIIKEK